LEPGDRVRIVEGAFEGYEAIFDATLPGKERVQVLLSYLSEQPKRLIIKPEQIQKMNKK
jgi:transcription antitermination factor NusG